MTYTVRVERIGAKGIPEGVVTFHEVGGEGEALAIATYEIDAHPSESQRIASVFDATGHLIVAYAGRRRGGDGIGPGDAGR